MMKFKKTLSLFLALVMCLGLVNFGAFADTTEGGETVLCTKTEDCAATIHEEGCPKYEAPTEENANGDDANDKSKPCEHEWNEGEAVEGGTQYTCALCGETHFLADDDNSFGTNTLEEIGDEEPAPQAAVSGEMASADFLKAAVDGVITLDGDVTLSDAPTIRTAVTIDLNGHTLSSSEKKITFFAPPNTVCELKNGTVESGITVARTRLKMTAVTLTSDNQFAIVMGAISGGSYVSGSLEVVDSSITKTGTDHGAAIGIYGKYTSSESVGSDISELKASGKTTITGSSWGIMGNGSRHGTYIELGEGVTVTGNGGMSTWDGGTVNVLGSSGIYHPQWGTLVTSADISGIYTGIEMRAGELIVNGGSITATTTKEFACDPNSSGTTTRGAAIAIAQHTTKKDIKVTINGGTFTGVRALNESNPQENDPAPQVDLSVNDGTFIGEVSAVDVHRFIKGGTFSYDVSKKTDDGTPTNYVADPYVCHRLEENGAWWNVHLNGEHKDCHECEKNLSASKALYVKAADLGGSDTNPGTRKAPFATLAHATLVAPDGATIYVLSNLEMNACARYWNKSLTIKGVGDTDDVAHQWTVTRGAKFASQSDRRSWYNPAMIEVDGSLRLESLIFDDAARTVFDYPDENHTTGTGVYTQEDEDGKSNLLKVQDAIIATYDSGDTVELAGDVELRNFGGMSAVRLSAGKLTMESGSKIVGSKNFTTKGSSDPGVYGAAAAVWIQGGELVMEKGSFIGGTQDYPMYGRAVYVDGGKATVNGTISGISTNKYMWNADGSTAIVETGIHIRSGAQVTLGGTIDNMVDGTRVGGAVAVNQVGSSFRMVSGAVIKNTGNNVKEDPECKAIDVSGGSVVINEGALITDCYRGMHLRDSAHGELNGTITKGLGGSPVQVTNPEKGNPTTLLVGKTGKIINNKVAYGAIYCQSGNIEFYGQIEGNYSTEHGGGIATPGHGSATIIMYDGATIRNNVATNHGGGVQVKNRTTFIMKGGVISGNAQWSSGNGGGVCVRDNGKFIMEGGTITNNYSKGYGGGISYDPSSNSVELKGGVISDNKMNATIILHGDKLTADASGGVNNDLAIVGSGAGSIDASHMYVGSAVQVKTPEVYMTVNNKIVTVSDGTKLGNASSVDNTALKNASDGKGWSDPLATFWAQNTSAIAATVKSAAETSLFDGNLPVYVLVKDGNQITSFKADLNNGVASFNVPASTNGVSIALVQPRADYGTLTLTAVPALVKDNETTDGNVTIRYTLTYTPSKTVLSSISEIAEDITLDVDGLSVTKAELETGFTKEFEATVPFVAGTSVERSARLYFTLDHTRVEVPSNLAVTRMENRPTYTVTYDLNGGTSTSSELSFTVSEGDSTPTIANPTREGYTFTGWNPAVANTVTEDVTYIAQWRSNGGGGSSGGGGTNIEDEDPPLANVDGNLNTTDHYAYIIGRGENCVQPLENITRAEVATIFFRLLTEDFRVANWSTVSSFPDVEAGAWYATEIATAERAGILKGCDDGNMQPDRDITRAEFTVMAIRFLNGSIEDDGVGDFADTADHWAAKEIRLAAKAGWIKGYGNNFRPNDPITRAEAMTIINRMLDRVPGETFPAGVIEWEDNPKGAWYYADVMEATNGHDYEREEGSVVEKWTALTPYRDWIALEAEWTANNGASAPASEEK